LIKKEVLEHLLLATFFLPEPIPESGAGMAGFIPVSPDLCGFVPSLMLARPD
jgi:hypothetical protein